MSIVERQDKDGVAVLTMNRPDVLNALSLETFLELEQHLDDIAASGDAISVIVLRGAGRSFCAGVDLKGSGIVNPDIPHYHSEVLFKMEAMPQVIIASVQGHCYTGGLELVLACDLIVCADDARFCDTHAKFGIIPGWGMPQRLPELIGLRKAKEIMFTSRVVPGTEAAELGLANLSVPPADLEEKTLEFAATIAANSSHVIGFEKRAAHSAGDLTRSDALREVRTTNPGLDPNDEALTEKLYNRKG